MAHLTSEGFRSRVPKEAWTGRAWWQVCCGGCCLVIVILAVIAALFSSWFVSGSKKDVWAMPQRAWELIKTKLSL